MRGHAFSGRFPKTLRETLIESERERETMVVERGSAVSLVIVMHSFKRGVKKKKGTTHKLTLIIGQQKRERVANLRRVEMKFESEQNNTTLEEEIPKFLQGRQALCTRDPRL